MSDGAARGDDGALAAAIEELERIARERTETLGAEHPRSVLARQALAEARALAAGPAAADGGEAVPRAGT